MVIAKSRNYFACIPEISDIPQLIEWNRDESHIQFINGNIFQSEKKLSLSFHEVILESSKNCFNQLFLICKLNRNISNTGYIYFPKINWLGRSAEVQIFLDSLFHDKTYGVELAVFAYFIAAAKLNLNSLHLLVYSNNSKMIRMWSEVGFETCGILKKHTFVNSKFLDMNLLNVKLDIINCNNKLHKYFKYYKLIL